MRLAMLVAALALVAAGCDLADPVTKSRTDSVRGAAWQWDETEQVALDGAPIAHSITPGPTPTPTGGPFLPAFQPQPAGTAASTPVAPATPGPIFWPIAPPDEPVFEELDHTPSPEPSSDPCDTVGLLPDECAPEPDPCENDLADGCEPPDCEEVDGECTPPDCDGSSPGDEGAAGDGGADPADGGEGTGDHDEPAEEEATESPEPSPTPSPTPTVEPTDSPCPPAGD